MTKPNILELPRGVRLVYLAEGGANVIYRFVGNPTLGKKDPKRPLSPSALDADHCNLPSQFKGKLLRLRKETAADISYKEIIQNFDTIIRPLFNPEELVDQALIRLPEGLLSSCNEQLRTAELNGLRPKKRHGGYLCLHEPFGLLITDMTTAGDPGASLAELKPKWLIQSPSAPATAHRCRTCALREMKNRESQLRGLKVQRSFCPFDLVSEQYENVLRATGLIKGCKDRSRLARILYRNPTLQRLQSLQKTERDVGLQGPAAQSREMSLAMTLRDCTMFIKVSQDTNPGFVDPVKMKGIIVRIRILTTLQIPHDEKSPVEIRLGDLDLKTGAGGKAGYWRDLETQLISQGWYQGSDISQDSGECALHSPRRPSQSHLL
ncbi:Inositol-pentakisphosphate 2-kinase [Penicillium coprophilum]|uniref:Inositol-pentakisphosphate 2-kinase n=1 Tax=Penicillium coprophilum TaxID=36646 RepID=UPI00238A5710|nr:Inositol-pentakisphosphate 2-kinase [Penicillium coprophilum]KAJ5164617.1 Inositol-pentakisphosphate 2-kinase [Penicillium coprophilum]